MSCIGQLDRNLVNAMKNSAASETPVMNVIMVVGPQQDSSSVLHFLLMMTTTGKALDIVGNDGEGESLEVWRRFVLEFDKRAKSRAAGLMQKLLVFESNGDTAFFELFDNLCKRLKQVAGIDNQDEVSCGPATLRMQYDRFMRGSRLDQFFEVREGCTRCGAHADRCSERQGSEGQGRQGRRQRRALVTLEGER